MPIVSFKTYDTLFIRLDVKEELICYCELKRMGLPTADVFRKTKQTFGYTLLTNSYSFDDMQKYFEKTRMDPYGDLINILKRC